MASPLFKSASDWTLADLEHLVSIEVPEGVALELKRDLPLSDGAIGWRVKGKLHASERDGFAREIVALANSYGGTLVVGIVEAADPPSRAALLSPPIPAVFDLVERLRSSLSSIIDPPISGLEISAIPASPNGEDGYLVATVPSSPQRPHGYGSPPQVFARHDDRADPASMQEIQAMFWEARTNRERIDHEIKRIALARDEFSPQGEVNFQFAAIADRPLELYRVAAAMKSGQIIKSLGTSNVWTPPDAASFPGNTFGWLPTATGIEFREERADGLHLAALWEIDDTGIVSVTAANNLREAPYGDVKQLYPGWYAKTCGALIGLTNCVSRWATYDGDWILIGSVSGPSTVHASNGDNWGGGQLIDLSKPRILRPMRLSNQPLPETLQEISSRIWATFGLMIPDDDKAIENGLSQAMQFAA